MWLHVVYVEYGWVRTANMSYVQVGVSGVNSGPWCDIQSFTKMLQRLVINIPNYQMV